MSEVATLLPPNATPAMRAIEQAVAARLAALSPGVVRNLWNPALCDAAYLPLLAWAFAVEVWDSTWPEARKRQVIAASLDVHRRKGTRGALEAALAAVDHPTTVLEWFQQQPQAAPFTFSVRVDAGAGVDLAELVSIVAIINAAKNVRSFLSGLTLTQTDEGAAYVAAAGHVLVALTFSPRTAPPTPRGGPGASVPI